LVCLAEPPDAEVPGGLTALDPPELGDPEPLDGGIELEPESVAVGELIGSLDSTVELLGSSVDAGGLLSVSVLAGSVGTVVASVGRGISDGMMLGSAVSVGSPEGSTPEGRMSDPTVEFRPC